MEGHGPNELLPLSTANKGLVSVTVRSTRSEGESAVEHSYIRQIISEQEKQKENIKVRLSVCANVPFRLSSSA